MKALMSGNEGIARGAYEQGIRFASGYPGTPSTEILETFAKYPGVYAEWSPNEKVALEVGIGVAGRNVERLGAGVDVDFDVLGFELLRSDITDGDEVDIRHLGKSVGMHVPKAAETAVAA